MESKQLWYNWLTEIETGVSKANFSTWFRNTRLIKEEGGTVYLSVPNEFVKDWLLNKFHKMILKTFRNFNESVRAVEYIISKEEHKNKNDDSVTVSKNAANRELPLNNFYIDKETNLNPKYTFDSFIVGSSNQLAHATAISVSKNLGTTYNPLFIYGGVGLGKTHLLQAIGNELLKNNPKCKVRYMTSEKFLGELINSIRNKTIDKFKEEYKKINLLIVDDIQFIAGKEKTQDIFFSTFNELYSKNKQIVLSSDRPPQTIPALEERLRSRFQGGMIADIGLPDFETRLAILKLKTAEKNYELNLDVLTYIATHIQKNVRELEGALNRVVAFGQIYNRVPDLKEIKNIVSIY